MRYKYSCFRAFALILSVLAFAQVFSQLSEGGRPLGFKLAPSNRLHIEKMPAVDVASLLKEDSIDNLYKDRPYRFGFIHQVNYSPDNSGVWTSLPDGSRIWQIDVKSAGAYTINLAFSNFYLPPGAKLFIYSKDHSQVLGGFTSKNNSADKFFGTELINGDEVVVEYIEPAEVRGLGTFILFRIVHGYKDVNNLFRSFDEAGSCINNINCPQYGPYTNQKRSVVCILTGSNALCSGALVNNTLNDGTPYILTANHCGAADGNWVFRFNWEAPGCADPAISPPYQSIAVGTTVASNAVSDFNLVLMSQTPPQNYHVFYAGWNRSTTPATSVTCIHHPSGDIKKCSRADNPVNDTSYDAGNGPAQVWQIGKWTDGVTEPGSSGSPLFDENKRIVGQLYGGPSYCGAPDSERHDYYGRFSVSWDTGSTAQGRLHDWLDPDSSGALTNDGYDPYPPVNNLDIALSAIASPADSSCSGMVNPVILVQNLGAKTIYKFTVRYHIDSNPDSVFVYQSDSLVYFQSIYVNLPVMQASYGNHVFYANVSQPNDSLDQNLLNDSSNSPFAIIHNIGHATPFKEGFEEGIFPPSGWVTTAPPSQVTWQQANVGGYGASAHSASVDEFSPGNSTAGEKPELILPSVDLSNITLPSYIKFDVANVRFDSVYFDSLAVLASTDCGLTWSRIYIKGGTLLATAPDQDSLFVPTASQWRTDTINIDSFAGQAGVQFAFQLISGYGNVTYIDNIGIADTGLLGIIQLDNHLLLKVFPNPFTKAFTLQFSLDQATTMNINLYSVDGKLLQRVSNNAMMSPGIHQLEIKTGELSSGLYLLDVNNQFIKLAKE